MGVDLSHRADRSAARRALGAPEVGFVIGFVGRLAPQKNPLRLADVFRQVAKSRPDIRLVIVGDGELREVMEQRLEALGLLDAAIRTLEIDGRDAMAAFDCLVCTSDYESFGLIFPEALAAGVPIVSPPVGVAAEAITTETGVLTSFEPEDIARGVLEIASRSEDARRAMARACRERARLFDIETTVTKTRQLYDELLARKNRNSA
jgi:glycosyltransferase involved in cell wall biosynthesis